MTEDRVSKFSGLVCGMLTGFAVLLSLPFADMGFIDDWSYVRTAYAFARTGHFIYNGWATAMLGWQIVWSAPFLKLFGYSFTVARLSMLPFAIGCGWILHAILRRSNISNRNAVFGSLAFCLSPLFIPLAASYMSDVGGIFVILLCIYLCLRALAAQSDRAAIAWLFWASVTNLIGGTERQIIWLGALVMVPSTAWLLRKGRGIFAVASFLWLISVAFIFASIHWFYSLPYSVPEKLIVHPQTQDPSASTVTIVLQKLQLSYLLPKTAFLSILLLKTFLCLQLLILPVLVAWIVAARKFGRTVQIGFGILAMLLCSIAWILKAQSKFEVWLMPWLSHVLYSEGISSITWDMLGRRPVSLSIPARIALSIVVIVSMAAFAKWLLVAMPPRTVENQASNKTYSWHTLAVLYLPYCASYLILLVPRGLHFYIFDRYLLGILPIAIIYLLRLYEERIGSSLPVLSYVTLFLFALYGICATHDLFALNRARVAAVNIVRSFGVAENAVQAGFEYDGWTEIDEAHYVNESKIVNPANAYHPNNQSLRRPANCRLGFDAYTPALHPQYIVVLSPIWCLQQSRFAPVSYSGWLPPFTRRIYIQQVPKAMQDP